MSQSQAYSVNSVIQLSNFFQYALTPLLPFSATWPAQNMQYHPSPSQVHSVRPELTRAVITHATMAACLSHDKAHKRTASALAAHAWRSRTTPSAHPTLHHLLCRPPTHTATAYPRSVLRPDMTAWSPLQISPIVLPSLLFSTCHPSPPRSGSAASSAVIVGGELVANRRVAAQLRSSLRHVSARLEHRALAAAERDA